MLRVLIAVALIQRNLGKPLEDGLHIPHDVEMIPVEDHGHHIITTVSLERVSIEDNEISLNDDYEGEVEDNDNISRPNRAIDTAPCSAEVEDTDKRAICKDKSLETDLKENLEPLETTEHENVKTNEDQETNKSVETTEAKETTDGVEKNKGQETNESEIPTESKETDDGAELNDGQKTNESVEKTENKDTDDGVESSEGKETKDSVETNEVVLLNQTIRMNSSAFVDGKLTIVLNFEVLDDHTVQVVSSEIVDPADDSKDDKQSDDDDDVVYFSGPVHAHGKVCVAAHYGCEDDHVVEVDSSEIVHPGDVSKDNNETVGDDDNIIHFSGPVHAQGKVCVAAHYGCGDDHDEVDSSEIAHPGDVSKNNNDTVDDEDDDDEDFGNAHFCGPVHAQGNVCVGAHYGCGGPPISMSFSRPCGHGQHFSHPTSENDHDLQDDEDIDFAHCQYRCPNIACQYYPFGSCGPCRSSEYHFDHHQDHLSHHRDHHFDRQHNHQYGHHQGQENYIFNRYQDQDFDDYQNKLEHSHEHHYEDIEKYFTRVGNSDDDSDEEDDIPRWFPVSGYVPASGSVKIAARY